MPRTAKPQPTPEYPRLLALRPEIRPQQLDLTKEVCTIGRDPCCDIIIPSRTVSRLHARIRRHDLRCLLEDSPSRNGTYVNGRRIGAPTLINPGDQIGIGAPQSALEFHDPEGTEESLVCPLHFDVQQQRFLWGHTPLQLTPQQLQLLRHLHLHPETLCSRDSCVRYVWGGRITRTLMPIRSTARSAIYGANLNVSEPILI